MQLASEHNNAILAHHMDMDETAIFIRNLERLRKQRGWTMVELGDRSGVSRSQIALVVKGESQITVLRAGMIAKAFGLSLQQMLQEEISDDVAAREKRLTNLFRHADPDAQTALLKLAEMSARE